MSRGSSVGKVLYFIIALMINDVCRIYAKDLLHGFVNDGDDFCKPSGLLNRCT